MFLLVFSLLTCYLNFLISGISYWPKKSKLKLIDLTARCLLKAVFLPHSEQESPRIHIKQRLKQQKTAPQALWRSWGEKTREQIQGVKRKKIAFRSSVAPRTSLVTILRYVPREYMSGNSKTRETALNGPVVDREARGEIPKKPMYAIPKIVMIKSS